MSIFFIADKLILLTDDFLYDPISFLSIELVILIEL